MSQIISRSLVASINTDHEIPRITRSRSRSFVGHMNTDHGIPEITRSRSTSRSFVGIPGITRSRSRSFVGIPGITRSRSRSFVGPINTDHGIPRITRSQVIGPCSLTSNICTITLNQHFAYRRCYSRMMISRHNTGKRGLVVCSSLDDPAGVGNWKSWIVGMVLTVILPFVGHKLGALLLLANKVENAAEKAKAVADLIEKSGEVVGKVAEEISEELPEGGKLRNAAEFLETLAKETAKDAHLAGELMEQVQDVEDVVENIMEGGSRGGMDDKAKGIPPPNNNTTATITTTTTTGD